jgi:hypothetical protein
MLQACKNQIVLHMKSLGKPKKDKPTLEVQKNWQHKEAYQPMC